MRIFLGVSLFSLLLALCAWSEYPLSVANREFQVRQGDNARKVAERLEAEGVVFNANLFGWYGKALGWDKRLKPGYYPLDDRMSVRDLWQRLINGRPVQVTVSIPEGVTLWEMRQILAGVKGLRHDSADFSEAELANALQIQTPHLEGLFFPSTYHLDKGSSDLTLYRSAHEALNKRMDALWAQWQPDGGRSKLISNRYAWLTLASVVEKETGHPDDRADIAAVFLNRLRIGMRLQSDPTVIYGMGDSFNGNLRRVDLLRDTPFNSYTRAGLPPTPIALVGEDSLRAVLYPKHTRALYFVAMGNGRSYFSNTLVEHNQAVRKYQLGGK